MEKRYLLHELRLQNNIELDEKKSLDSKAANIAGYSVTFTVLLFGFGSFLLEKIHTDNQTFALITGILVIGVLLSIVCVICSVQAFRLQSYRYVVRDTKFFTGNYRPSNSDEWQKYLNTVEIQAWIDDFQKEEDYEDFMIKEHLIALRTNSLINDNKASLIERGQVFFISAVSVIPVVLLAILIGFSSGILKVE